MNTQTPPTTTDEQSFANLITEIKQCWPDLKDLRSAVADLSEQTGNIRTQIDHFRRVVPSHLQQRAPLPGRVSEECAQAYGAALVLQCAASGALEALAATSAERDVLLSSAKSILNVTTRAALTTGDIPLPTQFSGELRELISQFGVARKHMFHYPLGRGTSRPPRMGARPAFGVISMSTLFPEKSPGLEFASLESHKIGGLIRVPREIEEQSIVSIGHFITSYAAVEFARVEDTFAFLADGSALYETVKGIVRVCSDNDTALSLAATLTRPSDATLDDFRALRRKANKAALNGRISCYFLDTTWETRLSGFNSAAETVYRRLADGSAILDGYPIVWTDVLQPYDTAPAAAKPIAVFGAPRFWWFAEHGQPRIDTSFHVFFANDQLAVRCLEEIDFDYAAPDAMASLSTAAA